jgi:hypothetical protein
VYRLFDSGLAFGVEYCGEHIVTLEAAKSTEANIPRYRITAIQPPASD